MPHLLDGHHLLGGEILGFHHGALIAAADLGMPHQSQTKQADHLSAMTIIIIIHAALYIIKHTQCIKKQMMTMAMHALCLRIKARTAGKNLESRASYHLNGLEPYCVFFSHVAAPFP